MFAKGLIVLLLLSVLLVGGQAKKVGGLSEETPVDAKVIKIANTVRHAAQLQLSGESFSKYTPVTYATQTVAGVNYFIRVDIGAPYHIVLRVYSSFDGSVSLHSAKSHVAKDEAIPYF